VKSQIEKKPILKAAMPADADPILINAYLVFFNGMGKMYLNFRFNKIIIVYIL